MFVYPHPFVIKLYIGEGKPDNCEEYLNDFLEEYKDLKENGSVLNDKHYSVQFWCMTCDAPARQFIKCIKEHRGFFACERGVIKGERIDNTVFLSTSENLRSDKDFDTLQYQGTHQHFISPIVGSAIKCIQQFPLDYMRLVCLGAVKRLLQYLKEGP